MKKEFFLLSLLSILFFLCFTFQVESPKDYLVGKWILKDTYSPDFSKKINSLVIYHGTDDFTRKLLKEKDPKFDLSKLSDSSISYVNDFEKNQLKEFKKDGTFIFTYLPDGSKSKGIWKLQLDNVPNRNYNSILLDYDANNYINCCVPKDIAKELRNNTKRLNEIKKRYFNFIRLTKDSIISRRYIDEPNNKGYKYLIDVYIKQK